MGMPDRWLRGPRPDPKVLALIELLKISAEKGQIRALAVITVDPNLNVETCHVGDIDQVRKRLLAAGLIEASHQLLGLPATQEK